MKIFLLERKTILGGELSAIWSYFSVPSNLRELTPVEMQFEPLLGDFQTPAYAGQILHFSIRPQGMWKMYWTTEITEVHENSYFVDVQRFGPYAFWHHLHRFERQENGVLMTDMVHYAVGRGFLGNLASTLFIRPKLEGIFDYRTAVVQRLFPQS